MRSADKFREGGDRQPASSGQGGLPPTDCPRTPYRELSEPSGPIHSPKRDAGNLRRSGRKASLAPAAGRRVIRPGASAVVGDQPAHSTHLPGFDSGGDTGASGGKPADARWRAGRKRGDGARLCMCAQSEEWASQCALLENPWCFCRPSRPLPASSLGCATPKLAFLATQPPGHDRRAMRRRPTQGAAELITTLERAGLPASAAHSHRAEGLI